MRMSSIWGRGHILIVLVAKKNGGNLRMKGILKLVIGWMLIQSFVTYQLGLNCVVGADEENKNHIQ